MVFTFCFFAWIDFSKKLDRHILFTHTNWSTASAGGQTAAQTLTLLDDADAEASTGARACYSLCFSLVVGFV